MPKSDGYYCPNCGAHKALITYPKGEAKTAGGGHLPVRHCECSSCKATWLEIYHATEYQYLEVPAPPDPADELLAAAEAVVEYDAVYGSTTTYERVCKRLSDAIDAVRSTL